MIPIKFKFLQKLKTSLKSTKLSETQYKSLFYQDTKYEIGDDVISMTNNNGGWSVGRITRIYQKSDESMPNFDLIWFWKANKVIFCNSSTSDFDSFERNKTELLKKQ